MGPNKELSAASYGIGVSTLALPLGEALFLDISGPVVEHFTGLTEIMINRECAKRSSALLAG